MLSLAFRMPGRSSSRIKMSRSTAIQKKKAKSGMLILVKEDYPGTPTTSSYNFVENKER